MYVDSLTQCLSRVDSLVRMQWEREKKKPTGLENDRVEVFWWNSILGLNLTQHNKIKDGEAKWGQPSHPCFDTVSQARPPPRLLPPLQVWTLDQGTRRRSCKLDCSLTQPSIHILTQHNLYMLLNVPSPPLSHAISSTRNTAINATINTTNTRTAELTCITYIHSCTYSFASVHILLRIHIYGLRMVEMSLIHCFIVERYVCIRTCWVVHKPYIYRIMLIGLLGCRYEPRQSSMQEIHTHTDR